MKKLIALLLALVMVLGLGTVALADEPTPTVKVLNVKDFADALNYFHGSEVAVYDENTNTVTLKGDYVGTGLQIYCDVVLDLNGYTMTLGPGAGDSTTETNGLQLNSNYKVTIKNGTITSRYNTSDNGKEVKHLIQNYANLTLDNVVLDGTQTEYIEYVLSCSSGTTTIKGGTEINARDGAYAFDVSSGWGGYDQASVIVKDAVINGNIDFALYTDNKADLNLEFSDDTEHNGEIFQNIYDIAENGYPKIEDPEKIQEVLSRPNISFELKPSDGTVLKPGNGGGLGIDTADCDLDVAHLELGESYGIPGAPTNKSWKVSTKWAKGGAMVEGISWNKDNGRWELTLKENYTISTAKDLEGTITFTGKGDNKGRELEVNIAEYVSNHLFYVEGVEKADIADTDAYEAANNTIYVCDEDAPGYVKFNDKALLSCTLNMAAKEKAFMYNDESMIEALEEKFPEADIECYNFGGQPTFKNAARFTLQADYADQYYIYSYTNGKLAAQDAEWDNAAGVYTWETRTPTSYVISDVELVAAAEAEADFVTKNPDTGANDVVGIAAALAVVSLAAAAAVSLKK